MCEYIIVNTFTDRRERARAVGVWGSVSGLSLALGPVLGGVLVSSAGWRSVFWINVPIGIAAIVLTQRFVPESKAPRARRLDPAAQVLIVIMLAAITYGVIEGPRRGWGSATIIGLFILGAVAAALLVVAELRRREPLIDVPFFRSAPFAGASVIAVAAFGALGGFLFLDTLYLQDVRGYTPVRAGLLTIPMAVMIAVFAQVSGRLVGRRGPRQLRRREPCGVAGHRRMRARGPGRRPGLDRAVGAPVNAHPLAVARGRNRIGNSHEGDMPPPGAVTGDAAAARSCGRGATPGTARRPGSRASGRARSGPAVPPPGRALGQAGTWTYEHTSDDHCHS